MTVANAHRGLVDSDDDRPRIRPSELAAYWNLNVKSIYRAIHSGRLPAYRLPGGGFRIRPSDAREYGELYDL